MKIIHVDLSEDMSNEDKHIMINRFSSLIANIGEAMYVEKENPDLPKEILAYLINSFLHDKQIDERLKEVTKAGNDKDYAQFDEVPGEVYGDNVVSFPGNKTVN